MSNGQETTRLPVRSTLFKQRTGGLVVRWVTTSEYPLLYVFCLFLLLCFVLFVRGPAALMGFAVLLDGEVGVGW